MTLNLTDWKSLRRLSFFAKILKYLQIWYLLEEFIKNNPNVSKYADKRSYNSFIFEIESFETKYNNINNVYNLNDDSYVIFYSLIDSLNERIFIRTYLELLRNENIKLKTQGQKYNEEIMKKHEEWRSTKNKRRRSTKKEKKHKGKQL